MDSRFAVMVIAGELSGRQAWRPGKELTIHSGGMWSHRAIHGFPGGILMPSILSSLVLSSKKTA
jgi:hypothetical protein